MTMGTSSGESPSRSADSDATRRSVAGGADCSCFLGDPRRCLSIAVEKKKATRKKDKPRKSKLGGVVELDMSC